MSLWRQLRYGWRGFRDRAGLECDACESDGGTCERNEGEEVFQRGKTEATWVLDHPSPCCT